MLTRTFFILFLIMFIPGCFKDFVRKQEFEVLESSVERRFNRINYDLNITKGAINENRGSIDVMQEQLKEVSEKLGMLNNNIKNTQKMENVFNDKLEKMMDEVVKENERLIKEINKTRELAVKTAEESSIDSSSSTDSKNVNVYNKPDTYNLDTGYYHTVGSGESISKIAKKYSVPIDAIIQANGITNPNSLYVGQKIFIPDPGTNSTN